MAIYWFSRTHIGVLADFIHLERMFTKRNRYYCDPVTALFHCFANIFVPHSFREYRSRIWYAIFKVQ